METKKCFPSDTRRILDVLGFIEDHVLPFDTLEVLLILSNLEDRYRLAVVLQIIRVDAPADNS